MYFYEIKVKYTKQTGEDNPVAVPELYLVEGINCTDVEGRLIEAITPFVAGELEVLSCKTVHFFDIITSPEGSYWFKVRAELIDVDDSGKERRKAVSILVQSTDIAAALKSAKQYLSSYNGEITALTMTKIMDVLRAVN